MLTKKTFISSKFYSMLAGGIVTSFLVAFTVMADAFIAGIKLGEDAVTGINLVLPAYSLASFFALLFSLGVPILYSKEVGAFEREEANRTFGVGILGTSISGIMLFIILIFGGNIYLEYMGAEGQVLLLARDYLYWIKYVVIILPLRTLLSEMVFSDGDEAISTLANAVSAVTNIIFSILLASLMGTSGLGLASFLSLFLSIVILLFHFVKKGNSLHPNLYFSAAKLRIIIRYSIVDSSTYLFLMIFISIMNRYVVKNFGSGMLILIAIVSFIKEVQFVFDGVGAALTPIISVYLGEKTYQGVNEVWKLARKTAVIESIIVTAVIIIGAPVIVGFLGIVDPQKVQIAVWGLRIMSLTLIFTSRMYLDSSYFILIDKIPLGVLICALRDLVIAAPLAIFGGWLWGIYGMFIGLMIAPALGYLLSYIYICLRYDKDSYVLFIPPMEKERHIWMYEFEVRPELITATRDQIGRTLKDNGQSSSTVNRVMVLFEELFMLVYDLNPGKTVLAECIVEVGNNVHIITKDNGVYYDLTDTDHKVDSFRSFVVSGLTEKLVYKKINFASLSFNRNAFEIE
ncbi:Na+-driven multidrug efflux pump [Butyrivibrio sp. Su6]|uniref:MATE family efflux transporter n=1 Tax=Butyrivibrio sp. Su6 TaxID=1520810 RepID=UPI00089F4F10|nr:MATE family efflux transporter [Butyrivibrio sp. Su6]SEF94134.1 Na+-driven multidrug efflux pump [Butyrivibrio sp. Su6]